MTAARLGVAVLVWSAGACDPSGRDSGSDNVAAWQSGSRLRARVLDGGGGAKLFVNWSDTALGVACGFARAQDGVTRCLPMAELAALSRPGFFGDSQCTVPLVKDLPANREPYYRVPTSDLCDLAAPVAVKAFGEPVMQVQFGLDGSGRCRREFAVESAWFPVIDVDPSRFVAATLELTTGAPLGMRILRGADGSRDHAQLVDTKANRACVVAADHFAGAPAACVPANRLAAVVNEMNVGAYYADAACTVATAVAIGCVTADVALAVRRVACTTEVDLLALGPLLWDGKSTSEANVFRKSSECQREVPILPMPYYAVAGPVTDGAYPIAPVVRTGTGRLRASLRSDTRGLHARNVAPVRSLPLSSMNPFFSIARAAEYQFYDDVRQAVCSMILTVDRQTRCLPSPLPLVPREVFSDVGCSQPAYRVFGDLDGCASKLVGLVAAQAADINTAPVTEVRVIGESLPAGSAFSGTPAACVPIPILNKGEIDYALGPPIPLGDFATVAEVTE